MCIMLHATRLVLVQVSVLVLDFSGPLRTFFRPDSVHV